MAHNKQPKKKRLIPVTYKIVLAGIVCLFLGTGALALTPLLSSNGDSASYIVLAESLAGGQGYVNTIYPGSAVETQYPPLLPLLLSPLVFLFGRNYLLLKLVPLAFGAAAIVAVFELLQRQAGRRRALVVALLTAINASYLRLATDVLTETAYLFFSVLALWAVGRLSETDQGIKTPIAAALLIGAAFYTRTVGVTTAIAGVLFLLLKRRWKTAFLLVGMLFVIFGWWGLRSIRVNNSYIHQFLEYQTSGSKGPALWVNRVMYNAPRYAGKVMADLIGGPAVERMNPYHPVKIAVSLILSLLFTIGFIRDLRSGISLEGLYLLSYLGIYAVWPYHSARFLVPVLPFVLLHILSGAEWLGSRWPSVRSYAQQSLVTALAVTGLIGSVVLVHHNRTAYYYPEMSRYREACLWVDSHTPDHAVLLCRKPRIAALWSNRKAWWYTGSSDEAFFETCRQMKATHVIVNDFPIAGVNLAGRFNPMLHTHPNRFQLIYESRPPRVSVYKIRPDGPPDGH